MTRTQIQLPDALYSKAKQIAQQQEISLAELVRRGLEHMIRLYPPNEKSSLEWSLPRARALGAFKAPVQEWRELANASAIAERDPD